MEIKMKNYYKYLLILLSIQFISSANFAQKNWAYQFDGEDDNGYASQTYNVSSDFSVETWVYLIGDQEAPILYQIGDDGKEDFAVFVENGLAYFRLGVNEVNSGVEIPIFQWVHIAGTYDGTTFKTKSDLYEIENRLLNPINNIKDLKQVGLPLNQFI